ncbi:hypothetical protein KCU61_g8639, partial [Aureobasidium melanogenum]
MGSPKDHLPQSITENHVRSLLDTLSSPPPRAIRKLKVTAEFHIIYVIDYTASSFESWLATREFHSCWPVCTTELILRISGNHIPRIKTENEASVLLWLDKNPNIPAPRVVAYDSSTDNPLGHEFILMTREIGECLADIYSSLTSAQMDYVLDLLIDINAELHTHTWSHIGGLSADNKGNIIPGPVLEETFWFEPDILTLWPPGETFESLNISEPYHSYTEYISAHLLKYKHAIGVHPSLEFMRDILPQLDRFLAIISAEPMQSMLNKISLRLAHKDLHFANILVDRITAHITGIVDWEFAGVVPFTRWNPSRAFLWNAQYNDTSMAEKTALIDRYEKRAREKGFGFLIDDAMFTSKEQESMQTAANFLRAIVEVCPRDQAGGSVMGWKETAVKAMADLGA